MKKLTTILFLGLLCGMGGLKNNLMAQDLKTEKDTVSFLLGYNFGEQIKQIPYSLDMDRFVQGLKDAVAGKANGFTPQQMGEILQTWQNKVQQESTQKQQGESEKQALENKEIGSKFLAQNAKEKGVTVCPSGLQYKVVEMGKGKKPLASDKVKVHYVGTLLDGTKFDSSVDRGEPITFPLNGVIKGWTEGLQLMPIGSKFIFYIPSDLGYGDRGVSSIPAGSTLVFEVELLDINPAE